MSNHIKKEASSKRAAPKKPSARKQAPKSASATPGSTLRYTLPLSRVSMKDVDQVGGKSASLGELMRSGANVPSGFTTTVAAYFDYMNNAVAQDTTEPLAERIYGLLRQLDASDTNALDEASKFIRTWVMNEPLPEGFVKAIRREYAKLGENALVAVRSSANAEDGDDASFAGMQETFLNVQNADDVVAKVHECLASLFHPRSIQYRVRQKFAHEQVGLAVTVQLMAQCDVAGVMFTQDPTGNPDDLSIDAVYGLGELIVGGNLTPDSYIVGKESGKVKRTRNDQEIMLVRDPSGVERNVEVKVPPSLRKRYKLTVAQIRELAEIGKRIEAYYGKPMDIEWGLVNDEFVILQARPATVESAGSVTNIPLTEQETALVLVTGSLASPGVVSGRVVILDGPQDCYKVQKGDILVADMTSPDYNPAFDKAGAVVTRRGGKLCHAAITCREIGIPCIIGAESVLDVLQDGQIVTVDASHGEVFEGVAQTRLAWEALRKQALAAKKAEMANVKTSTKVMATLAKPAEAVRMGRENVDGIGLVRLEELLGSIGIHPQWFVDNGLEETFISALTNALTVFCQSFEGRDIIVRTTDFKQNEMMGLKFGELYETVHEENPMLGLRGVFRCQQFPKVFAMEVEAYRRVRELFPNLHVMIPFVRSVSEMEWAAQFLADRGLERGVNGFKLWMMAELPVNVFQLEDFLVHVDGVSIGSNDLTQTVLGVDRDNNELSKHYDETHPAVLMAIEHIVKTTRKHDKTVGLCGQAATNHPDIAQKLVEWGATSISVSPDAIDTTREIVYKIEQPVSA